MAFRFEVQLLGLCHFIENETEEDSPGRRLCVLLPDLWDRAGFGAGHQSRMIYDQSRLARAPVAFNSLRMRELNRERVTFRYFYEEDGPGLERPGQGVRGGYGQTIEMRRLLGDCSNPDVNLVDSMPLDTVSVQALFDRGEISPGGEQNGSTWRVPYVLEPEPDPIVTPDHILISEAGLLAVEVVLEKFTSSTTPNPADSEVLRFEGGSDDVVITITADCQLAAGSLRVRRPLEEDEPDADFAAHYLFLAEADQDRLKSASQPPQAGALSRSASLDLAPAGAAGYPVPTQVAPPKNRIVPEERREGVLAFLAEHVVDGLGDLVKAAGPDMVLMGGSGGVKPNGKLFSRDPRIQEESGGVSDCQNCRGCKQSLAALEPYFWPRRSSMEP